MSTRSALTLFVIVTVLLAAAGAVADGLSTAVVVAFTLAVPSVLACVRLDRKEQLQLPAIFLVAVSLRWLACSGINYFIYPTHPVLFAPDEMQYDLSGWLYALYLKGRIPHPWAGGAVTGIIRLTGACYYLFGRNIMVPKLFVGVVGAWSSVLTALIARQAFSSQVARRAGWLAALFPSLILWSSVLMKDTNTLLSGQVAMLAFLRLRDRFSVGSALLFVLALGEIGLERPYEIIFVALTVAASFTVRGGRMFRNLALFVFLSVALFLLIRSTGANTVFGENDASMVDRLISVRAGYANSQVGSAIHSDLVDTSTPRGLLLWLPIGLVYFFFAPLPFTGTSIISLATTPEMLLFYALVPSLLRALKRELGERRRAFMPLFFYLIVSSLGWSVVISNVGTIYRYRAQVMFVVLILIAADQVRRRQLASQPAPALMPALARARAAARTGT